MRCEHDAERAVHPVPVLRPRQEIQKLAAERVSGLCRETCQLQGVRRLRRRKDSQRLSPLRVGVGGKEVGHSYLESGCKAHLRQVLNQCVARARSNICNSYWSITGKSLISLYKIVQEGAIDLCGYFFFIRRSFERRIDVFIHIVIERDCKTHCTLQDVRKSRE